MESIEATHVTREFVPRFAKLFSMGHLNDPLYCQTCDPSRRGPSVSMVADAMGGHGLDGECRASKNPVSLVGSFLGAATGI